MDSTTPKLSVEELIAGLKDPDDEVRCRAWRSAPKTGMTAVKPLAALMIDPDMEVARAAKRGLWQIVRQAGRPAGAWERRMLLSQLLELLKTASTPVRREILWMVSEVGGDEAVNSVAALLAEAELREDACLVLQRLPGRKAVAALRNGIASAAEEFRPALAQALRARGEKIESYPSQRLVPSKSTSLKVLAGS